jgi:transcriptional regulator with XRE-family HTH domain
MPDLEARRMLIATRLRKAREMAGLSQGQVARMLKVHRPSISESEAGRRRVSAEELAEMARIYGVSVSWLAAENVESADPERDRIELAARKLSTLKPADLKRLLEVIHALRG